MAEVGRESNIEPPPEAVLIKRHRLALGLSQPKAAARTGGVVSTTRWAQIEQGYLIRQARRYPTRASDSVLAHMAAAVGVTPEQLEELGKREAAEVLRMIRGRRPQRQAEAGGAPDLEQIARWFADESVPADERAETAHRFLQLLPYFVKGQTPPPDLFGDHNDAGNGQRTA